METTPKEQFLTIEEIATMLRVSEQKVRMMVRTGVLPSLKIGRQYRIRLKDFREFLETAEKSRNT